MLSFLIQNYQKENKISAQDNHKMIAFLKEHNTNYKNYKLLRKEQLVNAKGSLQNLSLFLENLCDRVNHCIKQGYVCACSYHRFFP